MAHLEKVEVLVCWTLTVSKPLIFFPSRLGEKGHKKVCFAYCLPPLFEPKYSHKVFEASELLCPTETIPSELMERTQLRPEEPFPLGELGCSDHGGVEIGLASSLEVLALGDTASARRRSVLMGQANPAWLAECRTWWKQHPDQYVFYLNATQAKLS